MGFLDEMTKGILDKVSGGSNSLHSLTDAVLGLIGQPEASGLQGLVQQLKEKGLGTVVDSWIGTGKNKPVSGDQIQHALGGNFIQQIADKLGISISEVSGNLANLLPEVIDKLTPNGKLPESDQLRQGLELLKKTLHKT
jgi:uncharacterized protein YidB (DUF937 family)